LRKPGLKKARLGDTANKYERVKARRQVLKNVKNVAVPRKL
jgi:hypothetical protein